MIYGLSIDEYELYTNFFMSLVRNTVQQKLWISWEFCRGFCSNLDSGVLFEPQEDFSPIPGNERILSQCRDGIFSRILNRNDRRITRKSFSSNPDNPKQGFFSNPENEFSTKRDPLAIPKRYYLRIPTRESFRILKKKFSSNSEFF